LPFNQTQVSNNKTSLMTRSKPEQEEEEEEEEDQEKEVHGRN
jgi:hypothetical protein